MRLTPIILGLLIAALEALPIAAQASDANHDFDFGFGVWTTHIQRLIHPLTGSHTWVPYTGTVSTRGILGGRGNVEEIEIDSPGRPHLELLGVRLYDTQAKQWHLTNSISSSPSLDNPSIGSFENGRGTFYDQEPFAGRMILVRHTFFDIRPGAYAYEQAFSGDGGRTWEPNFVAHLERRSAVAPSEGAATVADTSHDFDFNYGSWQTRIRSLHESASGASWVPYQGTVRMRKLWNGRAFLEEIKASNAHGGFEGVTLYLYDPQARQWSQTFAAAGGGTFDPSMVGTFHGGRGELVSQAPYGDQTVLMRDAWSGISARAHHFEIQISRDGAKTWTPIFIADLTRIGPGL